MLLQQLLIVLTQIPPTPGHIAGSFPPCLLRFVPCTCIARLFQPFFPSPVASICAYTHAMRSDQLLYSQILSKSHHGGIRTHGLTQYLVCCGWQTKVTIIDKPPGQPEMWQTKQYHNITMIVVLVSYDQEGKERTGKPKHNKSTPSRQPLFVIRVALCTSRQVPSA